MTTKYTAEDLQMNLLDAIAEAERMDARAHELCSTWLCGVKNDVGVYVQNVHEYEAKKGNCSVCLRLVLSYPMVYGAVDLNAGFYGKGIPLDSEYAPIAFSVFEDKYQAVAGLTLKVNAIIIDDPNIDDGLLDTMVELAQQTVNMAEKEI